MLPFLGDIFNGKPTGNIPGNTIQQQPFCNLFRMSEVQPRDNGDKRNQNKRTPLS